MNYFKILRLLEVGNKGLFDIPKEEQKAFLDHLGKARDDIDRSHKQYLCQNFFVPWWKVLLLNILFSIVSPIILIGLIIKGLFVKKQNKIDALASLSINCNFFDRNLLTEFVVDDTRWGKGVSLQLNDLVFCLKIFSLYFRSPFFVGKNLFYVAVYSEMIYKYSPRALLAHCEFSFSSSLLTAYCHKKGVAHINTMHGEKLYYIRDSFFHFDRCYVWDNHYVNLFIDLKAEPTQFRVFIPESLKFDCNKYISNKLYAGCKYYLAEYSEEELVGIVTSMEQMEKKGESVRYRPHPRYSNMELLRKHVPSEKIELPNEVTIQESIANCKYVIGSYTTVLNQAYFSGRNVVLDDMTFKSNYDKLLDLNYYLVEKDTINLSQLISNE